MSECEVLTGARIERLLAGELPENEKRIVAGHLRSPCDACLEVLQEADGEEILARLAGPRAMLSNAEAERLFEAAVRGAVDEKAGRVLAFEQRRPSARRGRLLGTVLALAAAFALAVVLVRAPADRDRVKGSGFVVRLIALAGHVDNGVPRVSGRIARGDRLAPKQLMLFRYELSAPGFVYLFARAGSTSELLFAAPSDQGPKPKGEHELASAGQALALQAERYGKDREIEVIIVAAPKPIEHPETLLSALDAVERRCEGCASDRITVRAPKE